MSNCVCLRAYIDESADAHGEAAEGRAAHLDVGQHYTFICLVDLPEPELTDCWAEHWRKTWENMPPALLLEVWDFLSAACDKSFGRQLTTHIVSSFWNSSLPAVSS